MNVGRRGEAHDIALGLAHEHKYDVVLIQEPWFLRDLSRRLSKKHPAFKCFTPVEDWAAGAPRTLSYIRKNPSLRAYQWRGWAPNRDILALHVEARGARFDIINTYNAPLGSNDPGQGAAALLQYTPSQQQPLLIAGDFNLRHPSWSPGATPGPGSERFVAWVDRHDLTLTLPPGIPTRGSNTIDLALANQALVRLRVQTAVEAALHTGSDHETLATRFVLPGRGASGNPSRQKPRLREKTTDSDLFHSSLQGLAPRLNGLIPQGPPGACSPQQLDLLAEGIVKAVLTALEASTKRALGQGMGQPWWSPECRVAVRRYHLARRAGDSEEEARCRKEMRRVTRAAKRGYWHGVIDQVREGRDIFRMVKWGRSTGQFSSPPLVVPETGEAVTEPGAKRDLLARVLLEKASCEADIPVDLDYQPDRGGLSPLPFPPATQQEVHDCLLRTKSTTPGPDEVPAAAYRLAWPVVKRATEALYSGCLATGWHPRLFRKAAIVAIPKEKPDMSSPRSYRPIALLSVLGKGLERLVARRIAWTAIKKKVLHPQHFGALPGRSATDLAAAVVHDMEEALLRGQVGTMLTLDVKGAFDAVLPGRLVRRLQEQGWPPNLVRWVSCFATGRAATLRLDDETGPEFPLLAGLPQGSPVSPVLFMLFLQPLFTLGVRERRRARHGFADDICLLAACPSLDENCDTVRADYLLLTEWGRREGLSFDPKKTELLHFSRKKGEAARWSPDLQLPGPGLGPGVAGPAAAGLLVKATKLRGALRWLGVYFDRGLGFKGHVDVAAAKAKRVAAGIKSLGNTVRGPPPFLLQRAVQACVQPILCYGAEAWWPGATRTRGIGPRAREVPNQVGGLVTQLEKVQNYALRGALPVYRTTPAAVLQREAGLPPVKVALDHRAALMAARLKKLDGRHPLVRRVDRGTQRPGAKKETRLLRLSKLAGPTEAHDPLALPPWVPRADRKDGRIGYVEGLPPKEAARRFRRWAARLPPRDIVVYSDGSQVQAPTRAAGAGWAICQGPGHPVTEKGRLPLPRAEVYDAEAVAALRGLAAVCRSVRAGFADNVYVCLDNLEVARTLTYRTVTSSQGVFAEFADLAAAWPGRERWPHTAPGQVRVRWVPGHAGVPGNEAADGEAGSAAAVAAAGAAEGEGTATLAWTRRKAKERARTSFLAHWAANAPERYRDLGLDLRPGGPPELKALGRFDLGKLYAARSAHGDFAGYHARFKHEGAVVDCQCGRPKAPEHFFFCRIGRRAQGGRGGRRWGTHSVQDVLGSRKGPWLFKQWLRETGFFRTICRQFPPRAPARGGGADRADAEGGEGAGGPS